MSVSPNLIPLCACGCGEPTTVSRWTDRRKGFVRGQPRAYRSGHKKTGPKPLPAEIRFWKRVRKGPGCWEWQGARDLHGYGCFGFDVKGDQTKAHRFSYHLAHPEWSVTDSAHICHRCDNPPCVRPDHLFLGNARINIHDAIAKGRLNPRDRSCRRRGVDNHLSRLTEDQVRLIHHLRSLGLFQRQIAAEIGISRSAVVHVLHGHTWSHVR